VCYEIMFTYYASLLILILWLENISGWLALCVLDWGVFCTRTHWMAGVGSLLVLYPELHAYLLAHYFSLGERKRRRDGR
jgi:hypothetical protein